ncbi:uncharacterized protein [Argopecten irradians]
MDSSREQLKVIADGLEKVSNELQDRDPASANRIQSLVMQLKHLACTSVPRPADLPTAKRRRQTTNCEDNCSDGSLYGLPVKPCNRESPCHCEETYQTVLRENHVYLMNDLQLDNTRILDDLVEEEVICTANAESLRRIRNRREKTRKLLTQLAGYGPKKFAKFKNALRISHVHLFGKLEKTECQTKGIIYTEECLACKIARDVDINDVVDHLYMSGVIYKDDLENVLQRKSRRESWIIIFKCIKSIKDRGITVLRECLKDEYPHIAECLRTETDYIKCYCRKAIEKKEQDLLSITRQASGPYTAIDNHYMSLPHDFGLPLDLSEHTYEQCEDECLQTAIYANINDLCADIHEPPYENCMVNKGHLELHDQCQTKDSSSLDSMGDGRYKRCHSWDNGLYFKCTENITGVEDPTYLHPCSVDTLVVPNDSRHDNECGSPGSDDSSESAIVRRGAFRRKCGRLSK